MEVNEVARYVPDNDYWTAYTQPKFNGIEIPLVKFDTNCLDPWISVPSLIFTYPPPDLEMEVKGHTEDCKVYSCFSEKIHTSKINCAHEQINALFNWFGKRARDVPAKLRFFYSMSVIRRGDEFECHVGFYEDK